MNSELVEGQLHIYFSEGDQKERVDLGKEFALKKGKVVQSVILKRAGYVPSCKISIGVAVCLFFFDGFKDLGRVGQRRAERHRYFKNMKISLK